MRVRKGFARACRAYACAKDQSTAAKGLSVQSNKTNGSRVLARAFLTNVCLRRRGVRAWSCENYTDACAINDDDCQASAVLV